MADWPLTVTSIIAGTNITLSPTSGVGDVTLNATGAVASITGTANQVIASASVGAITLSTPQNIATSSTPQFTRLGLGAAADSASLFYGSGTESGSPNAIFKGVAATGTNALRVLQGSNTSGQALVGVESSTGGSINGSTDAYSALFGTPDTANSVYLVANNIAALRVSSAGAIRFGAYGAGALSTDGSGNITATSDERLKIIKANFVRGLDEILAIQPIIYQWTEASGMDTVNTYAGLSAQNIMAYIPEAIGKQPDGYYSVLDRPIIAALINAIKTLQDEIVALGGKVRQPISPIVGATSIIEHIPAKPITPK